MEQCNQIAIRCFEQLQQLGIEYEQMQQVESYGIFSAMQTEYATRLEQKFIEKINHCIFRLEQAYSILLEIVHTSKSTRQLQDDDALVIKGCIVKDVKCHYAKHTLPHGISISVIQNYETIWKLFS